MSNWRYVNIHREADYYDGDLLVTVDGSVMEPLKRRSRYSLRLDYNIHTIKVRMPGFLGASVTLNVPRASGDIFDVYFDLGVLENQQIMTRRWGESSEAWRSVTWPAPAADLRSMGFDLNRFREELDYLLNPTNGKLYHKMKNSGISQVTVKPDGGGVFFNKLGENDFLERIYYNEIGDMAHTTDLQQIWVRREEEYNLIRQFIRDYMQNRYPGLKFLGRDMITLTSAAPANSSAEKPGSSSSSGSRNLTIRRTPENHAHPVKFYIGLQEVGNVSAGNSYTVGLKDHDAHELMFIATNTSEMKTYPLPAGSDTVDLEISVSQDGKVSIYRGVSRWIVDKDGKNIIMPWFNGNKLIRELRSLFRPVIGILYKILYEKDIYLRFSAEKYGIYFWNDKKCEFLISYRDIVWNDNGQEIYVDSDVDYAQLMQFMGQVLNSDTCPGLCTILPASPLIRKDPASAVRPSVMTSEGKESETTRLVKERIKEDFSIAGGKLFEMLLSGKVDHIEVNVLREEVDLSAHYTGTDEYDYEDALIVKYGLECDRIFRNLETLPQIMPEECYYSLDEVWERNLLMERIRAMINDETTFGVYMKDDRIYLNPEAAAVPECLDMNNSMTASLLWILLNNEFGEGTDFEGRIQTHPTTCYLKAEEDRLRITVMEESEGGNTRIVEFPYAECTYDKFPEGLGWETLHMELWQNRFKQLEREEDRAELEDYLMFFVGCIPHVIVEGNSFRSRRPGEELIDVDQTLTAKVMSQKTVKLFDLNGKFVDILRHSNISRCQIAVYHDYINFLFVDTMDETIDKCTYEFTELADADFLSGEGCFSRLTCLVETDQLSAYLGKAVCRLPYFQCGYYPMGEPNYGDIYLNREMVPVLDEAYHAEEITEPAKSESPAKSEEPELPDIPEVPEIPEVSVPPEIAETPAFSDVPEVTAESEPKAVPEPEPVDDNGPAFSVHASPTTWAIVAAMNLQFAEGGGLNRYMKDGGFSGADMSTSAWEIGIGFWKNGSCTTRLSIQYVHFNKGIPGEFKSLSDDDQQTLQAVIRTAVPYFDI